MSEDLFHLGAKALLQNEEGKFLILKKNKKINPFWDLPGGRLNRGESVQEAFERELFEELGLKEKLETTHLLMFLAHARVMLPNQDVGLILTVYKAKAPVNFVPILCSEHSAFEWLTANEAVERLQDRYPMEFLDLLRKEDTIEA